MSKCSIYIEIKIEFYKNWKTLQKILKDLVIGVIEVIK